MSRRMPMAPMTLPSVSRRADAFKVVAMISPEALRGRRGTLRLAPCLNYLAQSGHELPRLVRAQEARQRMLDDLIGPKTKELGDGGRTRKPWVRPASQPEGQPEAAAALERLRAYVALSADGFHGRVSLAVTHDDLGQLHPTSD